MTREVQPFDSGTQYGAWRAHNCYECAKFNPDKFDGQCDIDEAIGLAYIGSGKISERIAERMGYRNIVPGPWTWECPEAKPRPPEVLQ